MEMLEKTASNEMWNLMWQTFENASMTYDLVSAQNSTKMNHEDNYFMDNPAKLGILTGFIIACVADFKISTPKLDACLETKLGTMSITMINLISFVLLAPLITTSLTTLFVYRTIVELVIKYQLGNDFVGLLEGTDCVWALEEPTALSVINVIALLEKKDTTNDEIFLTKLKNLIKQRLLSSNFDKLNWVREKKYGYFYWRRNVEVTIDERVRWIDEVDETHGDVDENWLRKILTKATNKNLPRQHSTSWEILVCRSCDESSLESFWETKEGFEDDDVGRKTMIPLLFRVHHCLGDGVALLRLLLESIADPENHNSIDNNDSKTITPLPIEISRSNKISMSQKNNRETIRLPVLRENSSILGTLRKDDKYLDYANDLISATMPFTVTIPINIFAKLIVGFIDSTRKFINDVTVNDVKTLLTTLFFDFSTIMGRNCFERFWRNVEKFGTFLYVVISIPSCLIEQALRSMDNSALHGPVLTGEKYLSCWMETEVGNSRNVNLTSKIRDVKNATGTRFGDVVLAALSDNLHRYFTKIGEAAPKTMTVVIPARMIAPSQNLSLQNGFSVGLHRLCISEICGQPIDNDFSKMYNLWKRLDDVSRSSEKLRDDPDYLINFWVMKWLSAALPECLLKPVLESRSTMAFSNLPGPGQVSVLGCKLKNVAFWIPHRGTTGLGCSFLTYGGKVHFCLVADSAVMRSQQFLDDILRGTLDSIDEMYDGLTTSRFSNDLRVRSKAPTEKEFGVL